MNFGVVYTNQWYKTERERESRAEQSRAEQSRPDQTRPDQFWNFRLNQWDKTQ